MRWVCAVVVAGVVSGFALLLVTGEYEGDGPVVAEVSRSHGLHGGDVLVLAGWAVAMLALTWLVIRTRRGRSGA